MEYWNDGILVVAHYSNIPLFQRSKIIFGFYGSD